MIHNRSRQRHLTCRSLVVNLLAILHHAVRHDRPAILQKNLVRQHRRPCQQDAQQNAERLREKCRASHPTILSPVARRRSSPCPLMPNVTTLPLCGPALCFCFSLVFGPPFRSPPIPPPANCSPP